MCKCGIFSVLIILWVISAGECWADGKSRLVSNLESGKSQTIVAYGTSLTKSGAWVRQLQEVLDTRYPGKATILNRGKGGMSSAWGVEMLESLVLTNMPDVVFIEFAVNDSYIKNYMPVEQARSNLENMIDRILAANSNCEIVLSVMNIPVGIQLEYRPQVRDYYQMYRDVAKARGFLLIDHEEQWRNILLSDRALYDAYIPDGIHPSPKACKAVVTPTVLKALGLD